MSPERKKVIGNRKVEEFYWNGRFATYVDNELCQHPFDEAVFIVEMDERDGLQSDPHPTTSGTGC